MYDRSIDDIFYSKEFEDRGVDDSFRVWEVKIPRIRFKPGYQKLWRDARVALKELLGVKFRYQYRLTRYVTRFFLKTKFYFFNLKETSVDKTLIYSRLLPDAPTVDLFINSQLVYVNGYLVKIKSTNTHEGDFIQLVVSTWYYILYRWVTNWTLKRNKKFKKLVYNKSLASKHKLTKLKKQKSYYTPHWIYLARYDLSDVKPYLEVDYFTLSLFMLYEPSFILNFTPNDLPDFRINIFKLYNWKYIT
jgi:hypothetical protein